MPTGIHDDVTAAGIAARGEDHIVSPAVDPASPKMLTVPFDLDVERYRIEICPALSPMTVSERWLGHWRRVLRAGISVAGQQEPNQAGPRHHGLLIRRKNPLSPTSVTGWLISIGIVLETPVESELEGNRSQFPLSTPPGIPRYSVHSANTFMVE